MQKKFISNLLLMVLLNLLVKPVAIFGIDAAVQNRVGAEEYGIYFSLLNFSFLFNILLDFGINNYTTRHVAQYPNVALKYFGKMFTFRMLLFVIYTVFSFSVALILGWNSHELYLLLILVFNQFLVALIAYIRSHLSGLLLFKTEAVVGVLDRFLLIIFCGIALYAPLTNTPFKIEWFIWLQTLCYGLTFIIGMVILIMKIGKPSFKYRPTFSYAIIRKSFPYALLILLMMIYTRIDSVMVERMHENGKSEAGYYAQGFRLINALFLFAMLFSSLLFPIFSKMFKDNENVKPLLNTSAKLLLSGAAGLSLVTMFNSEYILNLIYVADVSESHEAFVLLMFSFIGMCSGIIYGTLLTAKGDLKFMNYSAGLGILINIGMNIYLIPIYGAMGAAIATVITQSFVSLSQVIYCNQFLKLQLLHPDLIRILLYLSAIFAISYYFRMDSVLSLILLLFSIPVFMMVFGLINTRQALSLFSKSQI